MGKESELRTPQAPHIEGWGEQPTLKNGATLGGSDCARLLRMGGGHSGSKS